MARKLFGRDAESRTVLGMLEAAQAGTGTTGLVEGIIGTGKTSLLRWAEETAREQGMLVLSATASPTEQSHPLGIVRQLLACLEGSPPTLAASQHAAGGLPDFPELDAWFALLSHEAKRTPLLVTVDGLHCADPQSLLWLGYLSRRIDRLPVALLTSQRCGDPVSDQNLLVELLERVSPDRHMRLRDLSSEAARELVAALGEGTAPGADTLIADSGGNPYLLSEQFLTHTRPTRADRTGSCAQGAELPARLRAVRERVLCLLRRLSDHALPAAYAASLIRTDVHADLVAELYGMGAPEASEALDRLVEAGLLHGSDLTFRHPVLAHLLYQDIASARRAELHRRVAHHRHRRGEEPEAIVSHLLRADRLDAPWMAALLLDTARELVAHDAATAMKLIDKVVTHGVPARLSASAERLRVQALVGLNLPASVRAQSALVDHAVGHRERAEESLRLADILLRLDEPVEARRVLQQAYRLVHPHDASVAARLSRHLTHVCVLDGGCADPSMTAERLESIVLVRTARGTGAGAVRRIARTILSVPRAPYGSPSWYYAVLGLLWAGDFTEAQRYVDTEAGLARADGRVTRIAEALAVRGLVCLHRGLLGCATGDAEQALAMLGRIGAARHHVGALASSVLIEVALEKGRMADAAELVDTALSRPVQSATWWHLHLWRSAAQALGRLGEPLRALELVASCGQELERRGVHNPAVVPWRSTKALLHAGMGDRASARTLARQEVEAARRWSAPFATGRALVALATVSSGNDALRYAQQAVDVLEPQDAPLLFARSLYVAGQGHGRTGNAARARALLHRANEVSVSLGADGLVEQVHAALRHAGGRPDPRKASAEALLTRSERQVAELASRGMSNRTIARSLQVSIRNVESHLTHCYRKLRISGRRELSAYFPEDEDEGKVAPSVPAPRKLPLSPGVAPLRPRVG
ncbi:MULTISPECIES: helix-turn-helix transcriptional regulator [Streptomyces]|uniref:helix-turn-helix transcriptional regulator n=1 Tax=Streptomyces TaxID=1883 RepID=UPI0022495099|nr:LuxR family transcriptional regulator [Streptomyces sp. JHD 1]MCX2968952.1 DUF2791 family P-loop domain-containing protein [Streptomyces sp. JHD 1]